MPTYPYPSSLRQFAPIVSTLMLWACGSENPSGPGGDSPMTARIDGDEWAATAGHPAQQATVTPGLIILSGGYEGSVITLTLRNIDGPGTYPLGTGSRVWGGIANLAEPGSGWNTPLNGAAGTVTISALQTDRIAGTFSFTADAAAGGSGSRSVTDGTFDFPLSLAEVPMLPDGAGGQIRATIGGTTWNAADYAVSTANGDFVITSGNSDWVLGLRVTDIAGPGTYPLSDVPPFVTLSTGPNSNQPVSAVGSWGGASGGGTGSIIIATITATRVTGTFSGTLFPVPGSPTDDALVITNGELSVGLN